MTVIWMLDQDYVANLEVPLPVIFFTNVEGIMKVVLQHIWRELTSKGLPISVQMLSFSFSMFSQ